MNEETKEINWDDFSKIEMRVGTVVKAEEFPKAKKPAYKLQIDFGQLGMRKTSAQITNLYSLDDLPGKKIVAVVNFPPKQIANFMSECLVLGAVDGDEISLLSVDKDAKNGLRIG
ncbi:tRNA-binding protein [Marivirga tractuosa]|uniref:Export-related chaperone CsaA n=1 Tax=Marivirga tractuosa (strain ATCC 23168 / DSM 4126 / NBRC 15989 / NCIMB 1408 / VKM B-1430 / H-43) TaxID=643867 RepID=E4TV34_MARTH|nr:tRNA-binding protein [Marivirga tractuosa]ADR22127.1 export-related chaperone CsaA [Marivirga tractuosa DSM 4126]BDD13411.1 tRNA-binding protein [Marivirga tractuosa]